MNLLQVSNYSFDCLGKVDEKKKLLNFLFIFAEVVSADSGFVEMNEGLKSRSSSSENTNSSSTPTRTDSTSDDTGCPWVFE